MNLIKAMVCVFKGHDLENDSIIDFLDRGNWLRRCKRCGLYHAKSAYGASVTLTKRGATNLKDEFEYEFKTGRYEEKVNERTR